MIRFALPRPSFFPSSAGRWLLTVLIGAATVCDVASHPVWGEELLLRARVQVKNDDGSYTPADRALSWRSEKTAIVVCDMWDQHWCRGATRRVAEMAPHMNEVISAARNRGVLIIHCPSSCMDAYKDTPMRKRAQDAPPAQTKVPLQAWCRLDPNHEQPLPIDDSDGGCDCWPRCPSGSPWRRQIDTLKIDERDAITDSAEAYNLMQARGIENVIVLGVHTNMCVLGRPFSIRQMVYQGQNVVLMRDMTDTMYNSRARPQVPHVAGTDLVVEHIEKFWCPTITSTDFTAKPAFRFSEADKPHVVFVISEPEYRTNESLPEFARRELESRGLRCTIIQGDEKDGSDIPGLEALKTADLLFLSVRRRSPRTEQLALIREFLQSGKPLVAIRTSSHAFHTRGQRPEGRSEWQEFDPEVLGGNYTGHHGVGPKVAIQVAPNAAEHPIFKEVDTGALIGNGSLYKVSPLASSTIPLLIGTIPDQPAEPLAWTNTYKGGRVFYTSLGHIDDFANPHFNRFLANAVFWALKREAPAK